MEVNHTDDGQRFVVIVMTHWLLTMLTRPTATGDSAHVDSSTDDQLSREHEEELDEPPHSPIVNERMVDAVSYRIEGAIDAALAPIHETLRLQQQKLHQNVSSGLIDNGS